MCYNQFLDLKSRFLRGKFFRGPVKRVLLSDNLILYFCPRNYNFEITLVTLKMTDRTDDGLPVNEALTLIQNDSDINENDFVWPWNDLLDNFSFWNVININDS